LIEQLVRNGVLIGAHWLGVSSDHQLSGDDVHDVLHSSSALRSTASERHDGFLLDRWERT
jgi:hypothetical protein